MTKSSTNKTIGIPQAVSYYGNYPFYYGFFQGLGIKIVLSDKTTNTTINDGCKHVVSETCLPIKVFVGHVINLLNKGCENIFIPSLQSSAYKINNCSKIRGLPEIIRNVINQKINIIDPEINKTEGISFKDFCNDIAHRFNIYDEETISSAIKNGWKIYNNFHKMTVSGLSYEQSLQNAISGNFVTRPVEIVKPLSVVIMAHGYNLFDERISMQLIKKLNKMEVKVYTSLNITKEQAYSAIKELGEIQYWANELDLTGTAAHFILNNKVDGIIALSAFGCGPDSLMVEEIQHHAKERELPMLHLNIDEHTGEAGFVTRLEAFVDMLLRKKRKQLINSDVIDITNKTPVINKQFKNQNETQEGVVKV